MTEKECFVRVDKRKRMKYVAGKGMNAESKVEKSLLTEYQGHSYLVEEKLYRR